MKQNKELNQQIRNVAVDKNGRPVIDIDERKSIYTSTSEALKSIPITNRNVGLTVPIYNGIKVVEYWWEKGIKDYDLVEKINGDDIPRINAKLIDLQNQIDGINNIEFKIFDSLPELGDSSIIYVVPNTDSQEDDDFIEYIWIKSQQRYERFGGLNIDGGVTINNFYTFDSNVFNINEESDIKTVSLNNKKISIENNGINIYKFDVGEIDNELQVNIDRTIFNTDNTSYGGGRVLLKGYYNQNRYDSKIYTTSLNYNTIDINCEEGDMSYSSTLTPISLHITDNNGKEITISKDGIEYETNNAVIFEMNNSNFRNISDKVLIQATGNNGFNINYDDDYGIKGFLDSNVKKVSLYTPNNNIVVTNNDIELSIAGDSYINLTYDTFNATFNQLIYLNAPTTKVKKVLFEQGNNVDIYLESYHLSTYGVTYHGLKASSNIYLFNNSYIIKPVEGYELTSYGLNSIKYRISSNPSGLGDNIIAWETVSNYPVLNIGKDDDIHIENNKITISKLNCTIEIDGSNNIVKIYNSNNKITINPDNIQFKIGAAFITMTSNEISDGTNTKSWTQLLS